MGLDMYLEKRIGVKNYSFTKKEDKHSVEVKKGGIKLDIAAKSISGVVVDVACWRKANAIHRWFVNNVQNGEDDCKSYYVDEEDLKALLKRVNKVLKASKLIKGKVTNGYTIEKGKEIPILEDGEYIEDATVAKECLPTGSGFFFGSEDYNEWYLEGLKYTKKVLTKTLKEKVGGSYYYQSSW